MTNLEVKTMVATVDKGQRGEKTLGMWGVGEGIGVEMQVFKIWREKKLYIF